MATPPPLCFGRRLKSLARASFEGRLAGADAAAWTPHRPISRLPSRAAPRPRPGDVGPGPPRCYSNRPARPARVTLRLGSGRGSARRPPPPEEPGDGGREAGPAVLPAGAARASTCLLIWMLLGEGGPQTPVVGSTGAARQRCVAASRLGGDKAPAPAHRRHLEPLASPAAAPPVVPEAAADGPQQGSSQRRRRVYSKSRGLLAFNRFLLRGFFKILLPFPRLQADQPSAAISNWIPKSPSPGEGR